LETEQQCIESLGSGCVFVRKKGTMDRGGMRHGITRPVAIQNLIFTKPIQRILLLVALLLCAEMGWGQSNGDYRTRQSGNWGQNDRWQIYNGNNWINTNTPPDNTSGVITIMSGHSIVVNNNVTVDQLVVASGGQITINNGSYLRLNNGTGIDISVYGTIRNLDNSSGYDGFRFNNNSSLSFFDGGVYEHAQNGGTIPTATWGTSSNCNVTGITNTVPTVASFAQSFGNFTWNSPSQTAAVSLIGNLTTINGDFSVISTGTTPQVLNLSISGISFTTTIAGNFIQSGGNLTLNGTNGACTLNLMGNFSMSGGTLARGNGTGTFNFVGSTTQFFSKSGGTIAGSIPFSINSGSTVDFGTSVLDGTNASFNLNSGAGIITANTGGISSSGATGSIQVGGARSYNAGASYTYNSTTAQVTGNGLSGAANLTINNSAGVTLSGNTTVSNTLTLSSGILTTNGNTLSITNTSNSAIVGASTSSFVNGALQRTLASGTAYSFPTGKGSTFLPFGLTITAAGNRQITVEAFAANCNGSATSPLGTLSTTEYWQTTIAGGAITGGVVSLARQSSLDGLDAIGRSATVNGAYSNLDGTVSGTSINTSNNTGASLGYFVMAAKRTITTASISPLSYCPGEAVSVPYSITGTFTAGNVFTAQLSDASGSFASPVSIGSVTSTSGGTISATLPGYANGTGYRIRVVSSTPAVTGSNNGSDIAVQSPVVITSPGSQCYNGSPITVNVGASCASAGIFRWYSDAWGSTLLQESTSSETTSILTRTISSTQTYYVSVTVGSCTSNLYPVSAYAIIPPTLNASAGGSFCVGSPLSLTSSASNYDNIFWEGPNGYYTTEANPTRANATTAMSGTYTVTTSSLSGVNLVVNGDFEQGNIGFTSNYTNSTDLVPEGRYAVVTNPQSVHASFIACGDHTSGSGRQMVINGATAANVTIWRQTVNVVPNTFYQFSYWVQSVVGNNPSQLQLYVNGVAAGPTYTAAVATCNWTQFIYNWSSGAVTSATLELRNQNIVAGGNDFALDDIIFQHTCLATSSVNVYVASGFSPSVSISPAPTVAICSGSSITFTATPLHGGSSPSYQWLLNGNPISGATSSTYSFTPTVTGTISCRMTSNLTCISGSATVTSAATTVTVNPLPTITTTGSLVSVRNNPSSQTTTLAYSGTTQSPTSYSIDWNSTANASGLADQGSTAFAFAAGVGTLTGIVVSANVPEGTYTGTMTIVNANGCSASQAVQLTVLPMTIIDSHPNDLTLCQNASGSFSVTSSVSSATYQWQYSTNGTVWNPTNGVAGVSGHTSSTLYINSAPYTGGTVWVRCVVTDGAYSEPSNSAVFTVFQAPSAPVVQSIVQPTCSEATGSVTLNGLPSGTWTLTRNPGAIKTTGTGSSTTISGLSTGSYTFVVANEDASWGCPTGSGTGLLAEFFSNMTLTGSPVLTRIDPTVNFDWANGSPGAPLGIDGFSVRWSGKIQPCNTGTYTFRTRSDDGIRLWVNGTQIINNWTDHAAAYNTGTISLTAGQKYDIVLEFYENGGQAVAELNWMLPGGSTYEIIPSSQLYYEATGCTSESTSVTINAQPATPTQPTITASGATTFCAGGSVTLSAPASSGYLWSTGATSQDIVVTTSGNYTVQVSNADGCQSVASVPVTVTVNALPNATLTVTDPVVCLGSFATITVQNAQSNVSYQLRLDSDNSNIGFPVIGDGSNSSFTITPSNSDVYNILATNSNNCSVELTDKATVTVNRVEVATTNTTGDNNDCADFEVPFNANTDQYNPGTTLLSFTVTRQFSSVNWSFNFSVSGGAVYGTLAQLPSGAIGTSPVHVNNSTSLVLGISSGTVTVDSSVNAVVMQFYIVNTPGSSQTVVFNATNVEDANSCTGSNRNVSHTILPMPAIGGFN
jgi:hypothetical protein